MSFLKSRWFTIGISAALTVVSQVKPAWSGLIYGALAAAGWALPHPADKAK